MIRSWSTRLAAVSLIALVGVTALGGDKRVDDEATRKTCRENLAHIAEGLGDALKQGVRPGKGGTAAFVRTLFEEKGAIDVHPKHLACAADPGRGEDADRIRHVVSYAIRDFGALPYDEDAEEPQVLAVCPHHDDGALIATDDLKVHFVSKADLGIDADAPVTVGRGAGNPLLSSVALDSPELEALERHVADLRLQKTCRNNVRQLLGVYIDQMISRPGRPKHSGPALLLSYALRGNIKRGHENVLHCPLDKQITELEGDALTGRYDAVDLTAAPPRDLVSYAVRDFQSHPLLRESVTQQIIVICPHHEDGLVIGYDDSSVKFMEWDMLGVAAEDRITIGPDSELESLRVVLRPEDVVEKDD